MLIVFPSEKLQKLFNSSRDLARKYGPENARKLRSRLDDLEVARSLEEMRDLPGRTHELHGGRAGTFAIDLSKGWRLIFEPGENPPPRKPDGGLDWSRIDSIRILNVEDYHD